MTLSRRIIACLDVDRGRVVKGVGFQSLRDIGDPVGLAVRYEMEGADEIVFLDITATHERRNTVLDVAKRAAERLFIPLTVGGGIRSADDAGRTLRAGADKISINSAAFSSPSILEDCAARFGSQCVVASIDAKREGNMWIVYTHGGKVRTGSNALEWAVECVRHGAGEILLTSIDRDGARTGYDLELTKTVAALVPVPVIASGGAGNVSHIADVLGKGQADAALLAGILHDDIATIGDIKRAVAKTGIPMRFAA